MAEASSLPSKIHKNFLECRICFEPFEDPRALPCLHAFCNKCLVKWSKTCRDGQSIVSCPLCKKVYQIPEGGVEGFPAHFLVTNLRDTVDAEKKTISVTQYCENHAGEIKRYFCENCGCAICSDCCVIDPTHKGHRFTRLKEAIKRQTDSLQNLFTKCNEVEQKYETAIKQTDQVEQNLESAANAAKDAVHHAKNEVIQQLKDLDTKYNIFNMQKRLRMRQIHSIKEKLQVKLATIKSVFEQGTELVNSGSEYEIASTYSSLSAKLQRLIQAQPVAADSKLSHIMYETPKTTSFSESSCKKQKTAHTKSTVGNRVSFSEAPHSSPISAAKVSTQPNFAFTTTIHSQPGATNDIKTKQSPDREIQRRQRKQRGQIMTTPQVRHPCGIAIQPTESSCKKQKTAHTKSTVGNRVSFSEAPHSSPISAAKVSTQPNFAFTTTIHSQPGATNGIKTKQSPDREIQRRQWKQRGQIVTTPQVRHPCGIVIQPTGDIVVASKWAPVKVFSRNGEVKCVFKDSQTTAGDMALLSSKTLWDIAITPSKQYIIPVWKGFHIYNSQGIHLSTTPTYVDGKPSRPSSVAVDSSGRIIVGFGSGHKIVYIHLPGGMLISKFTAPAYPRSIACTPEDELVISFTDNTLQVMDQSGHNARIIQPPPGIREWDPEYVCCSKQGELFVSNWGYPRAVYRYVSTDTGYKYADCISTMNSGPCGIALSANEEELFVVDNRNGCIKIFQC